MIEQKFNNEANCLADICSCLKMRVKIKVSTQLARDDEGVGRQNYICGQKCVFQCMRGARVRTSRAERAPWNVLRPFSFLSLAKAWKRVHRRGSHS